MAATESTVTSNPSNRERPKPKPKLLVITGPTASGKSKLAVDLASHFPVELINADSMQVYRGLDVLTNKLPLLVAALCGLDKQNTQIISKDFRVSIKKLGLCIYQIK